MTAALEGGEWSAARPGRTLPPWKTRYPFYRRLGGPQGPSGRAENLVPTGIRSWTVQPVVSRYTDWATRPINIEYRSIKIYSLYLKYLRLWSSGIRPPLIFKIYFAVGWSVVSNVFILMMECEALRSVHCAIFRNATIGAAFHILFFFFFFF